MMKLSTVELAEIKRIVGEVILDENNAMGEVISAINGYRLTEDEVLGSEWYHENKGDDDDDVIPTIMVRVLPNTNSGADIALVEQDGTFVVWETETTFGSGPAYNGCFLYDDGGNYIPDPDGIEWVAELDPLKDIFL